jgi:hemerythrin-like domain-containing protein
MPRNATGKSSTKGSTKAVHRASAMTGQNAIKILMEDHKKVIGMFDIFDMMQKRGDKDSEAKQLLVETACNALTIHAQIEEEIFYPAAREAIDDEDLLDEADVEHASARQLITELMAMQPGDHLYEAKFTVLAEYVKHHIQEEEKELFPAVKKAKLDLDTLGTELRQRTLELRKELGITAEEDEEEQELLSTGASAAKRRSVH